MRHEQQAVNGKNTLASIKREGNGSIIEKDVNEDIEVYSCSELE